MDPVSLTSALCRSIVDGPTLIGDLPEGPVFSRVRLALPRAVRPLNLQQKLGHLYEDALAQVLEASPSHEVLARNLQIQKDRHLTLGELDFVLLDQVSGQLIHLEVATKFYLAIRAGAHLRLHGPDARDSYFKKLATLRNHQLRLTSRHRESLPEWCRDRPFTTMQLVTGALFDHVDSTKAAEPEFSNPQCRRGRWMTITELRKRFGSDYRCKLIPKALWPVTLDEVGRFALEDWSPSAPLINRCVMLRIDNEPLPHFVTPDNYPT